MTESALPLSRLGGDRGDRGSRPRAPPTLDVRGLFRLLLREGTEPFETDETRRSTISPPGVELVERGLVGFALPPCLGGCGNEPMLTVLRRDLPAGRLLPCKSSAGSEATEDEVRCLEVELGR